MSATHSDQRDWDAMDLAVFGRLTAQDNDSTREELRDLMAAALRDEVTPRQREILCLYHGERKNTREIAQTLGLERSSVARTLRRGEARLRRCLRHTRRTILREEGRSRKRTRH